MHCVIKFTTILDYFMRHSRWGSKKNDKKLIRKLIREPFEDENNNSKNSNSLKKVLYWLGQMIKSIHDTNFREFLLKNQQELDKETKKNIIDLTKDDQQQEIPIEEKLKRRQEKDDRS
ncbi:hypothetical protein DFA_07642 [Cavenderia fasciculata]|uniref:Uncharacterized protein n=1 Tax=Cavenderia fasciculata TaxID=261658 RepID=F4Q2I5_CACFS|nr:uncharacterized protein DFA_07642 [Cavenderia fasciculata]EGG16664.1 hypothetical protein DFA_07642 [Cavenderia fasciculata]|eukprot:XP_004355138.1 hypothetical protein DFA_07642 [Cavenderia fasciculata]